MNGRTVTRIQSELVELVDVLLEDGKLSVAVYESLVSFIRNADPRILAAHDVYTEMQDVGDLIDTLVHVGELGTKGSTPVTTAASAPPLESAPASAPAPAPAPAPASASAESGNEHAQLTAFVAKLSELGNFSDAQLDAVSSMVRDRDERIMAIFDVYAAERNVADLVDSLERLTGGSTFSAESKIV